MPAKDVAPILGRYQAIPVSEEEEAQVARLTNLVARIEEDAEAKRKRTGAEPLGPEAIQAQHPHTRLN
jgi:hypothetical protein